MKRVHKIRLYPNNEQFTILQKHCGCARLAYNVCLSKWNGDYKDNIKHNYFSIKKWFNNIKKEQYLFVYEVSKWAVEAAIKDLDSAFNMFYKQVTDHPKFHKKGIKDSFRIDGSVVRFDGKHVILPKGLKIRMAEELRYNNIKKIYNVTISKRANMWFISVCCEIPESENQADGIVGIDLGIKSHIVTSDGEVFDNIRVYDKFAQRIKHLQRSLSRKKKGSNNYKKAKLKLSKVYYRLGCCRSDNLHKMTSYLTGKYSIICLEDLNVEGMLKNHKLANSIADVSFYEVRRQINYKAKEVRLVDRFAPTSKTCSVCGLKHEMSLSDRIMNCSCGNTMDRDYNAAVNIMRWATPCMSVEGSKNSMKQKFNDRTA